jgi:NADPH:quinone reductase-like Zn-dependent oxidoreductase
MEAGGSHCWLRPRSVGYLCCHLLHFLSAARTKSWVTHHDGRNGSNKEDGAFADYIVARGDLQIKIPDNVKDTDAATLGVGVATCVRSAFVHVLSTVLVK